MMITITTHIPTLVMVLKYTNADVAEAFYCWNPVIFNIAY